MQREVSFQSFQEMSGTSELTVIFNTGTLLVCSKVWFYDLVTSAIYQAPCKLHIKYVQVSYPYTSGSACSFFYFLKMVCKVCRNKKSVGSPESSGDCPSLNDFVVHRAGYPCLWTTPVVLTVNCSSAACAVSLCASGATVAP